jgi:acyl carrier protein
MMDADLSSTIERRNAILARIRQILIDDMGVRREPDEIDPDTPLFGTGLGLDSIDAVELLVSVETVFTIRVPDEVAGRTALRTLNTMTDTVLALGGTASDG